MANANASSLYDLIAEGMGRTGDDKESLRAISIRVFHSKASSDKVKMKRKYFPIDLSLQGHDWKTAERLDDGYNVYWGYDGDAFEHDREKRELKRLKASTGSGPEAAFHWAMSNKSRLDVMSIYLPGADNVGHGIGQVRDSASTPATAVAVAYETAKVNFEGFDVTNPINAMAIQAIHATDRAMSRLWAKIQEDGYSNAVMFAMTADHGQHQYMGIDHAADSAEGNDHNDAVKLGYNVFTMDIKQLIEKTPQNGGLGMSVWTRDYKDLDLDGQNLVYSGNGGMGRFYIRRDGASWQEVPKAEDIRRVAEYLNVLNVNEELSPLPYSEKFAPKKAADANNTTGGVFGSPSAIFARIGLESDGSMKTGFDQPYRWVKITYNKGADGKVDVQNDGYSASIKSVELLSLDAFLQAGKQVVGDQQGLINSGGPFEWPAFEDRMNELTSVKSGDIIVISDGREGYLLLNTEKDSYRGWHGAPTVFESYVPLIFSMPGRAFSNENGPIDMPSSFSKGYKSRTKRVDGYARNYDLAKILKGIHKEFRQ